MSGEKQPAVSPPVGAPEVAPDSPSSAVLDEWAKDEDKHGPESPLQQYTTRFQNLVYNPLIKHDPLEDTIPDLELFEKDYIESLRRRPYKSTAKTWLWEGAGVGALILLPFGPAGFAAGAVAGLLLGLCIGLLVDLVNLRQKHTEARRQEMKLRHLMRWARFYFSTSEDQLGVLLKVILEYEGLATMGGSSRTARRQLRSLYSFLQRDDVQHVLSVYVDLVVLHIKEMDPEDVRLSSIAFDVCIKCCAYLRRKPPPAVELMQNVLISTPWLTELFDQTNRMNQKHKERVVMNNDWLVYADAGDLTASSVLWKQLGQKAFVPKYGGQGKRSRLRSAQPSATTKGTTVVYKHKDKEDGAGGCVVSSTTQGELVNGDSDADGEAVGYLVNTMRQPHFSSLRSYMDEEQPSSFSVHLPAEAYGETHYSRSLSETDSSTGFVNRRGSKSDKDTSAIETPPRDSLKRPLSASHDMAPVYQRSTDGTQHRKHTFTSPYHLVLTQNVKPARLSSRTLGHGNSSCTVQRQQRHLSRPNWPRHETLGRPSTYSKKQKNGAQKEAKESKEDDGSPTVLTVTPLSTDNSQMERTEDDKENRLFRSLTDLVAFDADLKHQTPIGAYEFSFLTRLETLDRSSKEWECTVNKPLCQVYKLKGDTPVVLVKAFAAFPGLPTAVVSHFIRHIPTRMKWDKTFEDYRLIEHDVDKNEVIYCIMKAPWPIAHRDFLQWRRTDIQEDGATLIMMRSASHPDYPEKSGIVRAETIISGYIIRSTGPTSSSLFIVAQTDIRGLVPKFAVNQGAQRAPIQWTDALRKACEKYVKAWGTVLPDYASMEPSI